VKRENTASKATTTQRQTPNTHKQPKNKNTQPNNKKTNGPASESPRYQPKVEGQKLRTLQKKCKTADRNNPVKQCVKVKT
jgi:hypothetical protein